MLLQNNQATTRTEISTADILQTEDDLQCWGEAFCVSKDKRQKQINRWFISLLGAPDFQLRITRVRKTIAAICLFFTVNPCLLYFLTWFFFIESTPFKLKRISFPSHVNTHLYLISCHPDSTYLGPDCSFWTVWHHANEFCWGVRLVRSIDDIITVASLRQEINLQLLFSLKLT